MESETQSSQQTKPKLFCFVLMPFLSDFDDVYQIGIKEACQAAGAYCERVDEQIFSERILDRIYNQVAKADVVIADMTGRNANVFYEVGYAHALGKPTVLLTQNADDIPFDLKHFPHIIYESKLTVLREKLSKVIQWHVEHPATMLNEVFFPLSLQLNGRNPLKEPITLTGDYTERSVKLELTLENQGTTHLDEADFRIGLIDNGTIELVHFNKVPTSRAALADGRSQFTFPTLRSLMPGEFLTYRPTLHIYQYPKTPSPYSLVFRVFTKTAKRDFDVNWLPRGNEKTEK